MNKESNVYTFVFATVMVVVVAVLLSFTAITLKPIQQKNIELERKQNILSSINIKTTTTDAEDKYNKFIVKLLIVDAKGNSIEGDALSINLEEEMNKPIDKRKLPLLEAKLDDGETYYIIPLRGKGLWGPIWGYLSLKDDLKTIYGVTFDHEGETPGLGAEISTLPFQKQFSGKLIFDNEGNFTSVTVEKSVKNLTEHQVDGISGGTITSKGVQKMLFDCLSGYLEYFKKHKKQ
ncbi:MAG TPA: NADH:ubiquinone reductase (Na(+)-transporting) subunit C [Bacteroidales bacterium]|nr:NADH:ubiquinone reductase (Na(+)-transporting) subunit C [Bacteroidales bacterium]